jgi:hypothetical protein
LQRAYALFYSPPPPPPQACFICRQPGGLLSLLPARCLLGQQSSRGYQPRDQPSGRPIARYGLEASASSSRDMLRRSSAALLNIDYACTRIEQVLLVCMGKCYRTGEMMCLAQCRDDALMLQKTNEASALRPHFGALDSRRVCLAHFSILSLLLLLPLLLEGGKLLCPLLLELLELLLPLLLLLRGLLVADGRDSLRK